MFERNFVGVRGKTKFCHNMEKPKLLEIALNGEKIHRKLILKYLTHKIWTCTVTPSVTSSRPLLFQAYGPILSVRGGGYKNCIENVRFEIFYGFLIIQGSVAQCGVGGFKKISKWYPRLKNYPKFRKVISTKFCHFLMLKASLSMSLDHSSIKVLPNNDSLCEIYITRSSALPSLAAVMEKKIVALLYCVTGRQESPFCSKCVRRKCHHFLKLQAFQTAQNPQVEVASNDDFNDNYEPSPDTEEEDSTYNNHYMEPMPDYIRGKLYGYNFQDIVYPFCDSPTQQKVLLERISGAVNIPASLVPKFDPEKKCKHKMPFNQYEESIIKQSKNLLLFNDLGQRVFSTEVFARPSLGPCQCLQRYDGHQYLIWNLGLGRFCCYSMLLSYLHKWRTSGIAMYAMFKSIRDLSESSGITCDLTYQDIHRSVCGFFSNLTFNVEKAFACPTHGTAPKWMVADGKALGPLKRRVNHLQELDIHPEDIKVLEQSTLFKDRIFIASKQERKAVLSLLTGEMAMEQFVANDALKSENSLLVKNVVVHIQEKFPLKIPDPYIDLLSNIAKNSSARSLLQVKELIILEILSEYCREELDIRILENRDKMSTLIKSLPALWPLLDNICILESRKFLPRPVSKLIIGLLKVRQNTFENAVRRSNTDVYQWEDPSLEHPTMCYPNLPIWRYPSKYKVSQQPDADLCDKSFSYHGDFSAGIFSVGCGCPANITLGFELMLLKESPRNLFRFFLTRDVDLKELDGILVDFACLFEPYCLNREARMLEDKVILVDGAHWAGQKRLKKGDKAGKGGHLG